MSPSQSAATSGGPADHLTARRGRHWAWCPMIGVAASEAFPPPGVPGDFGWGSRARSAHSRWSHRPPRRWRPTGQRSRRAASSSKRSSGSGCSQLARRRSCQASSSFIAGTLPARAASLSSSRSSWRSGTPLRGTARPCRCKYTLWAKRPYGPSGERLPRSSHPLIVRGWQPCRRAASGIEVPATSAARIGSDSRSKVLDGPCTVHRELSGARRTPHRRSIRATIGVTPHRALPRGDGFLAAGHTGGYRERG